MEIGGEPWKRAELRNFSTEYSSNEDVHVLHSSMNFSIRGAVVHGLERILILLNSKHMHRQHRNTEQSGVNLSLY